MSAASQKRRFDRLSARYNSWRGRYDAHMLPLIDQASGAVSMDSQAAPLVRNAGDLEELSQVAETTRTVTTTSGSTSKRQARASARLQIKEMGTLTEHLERLEILLPSSYSRSMQTHTALMSASEMEFKMRKRQADKALDDVRAHIISKHAFVKRKASAPTSQALKARDDAKVSWKQQAINAAAAKYSRARLALISLGMANNDSRYRDLRKGDLKVFVTTETERQLGDSRRNTTSWIWEDLSFMKSGDDGKINAYYEDGMCPLSLIRQAMIDQMRSYPRSLDENECVVYAMVRGAQHCLPGDGASSIVSHLSPGSMGEQGEGSGEQRPPRHRCVFQKVSRLSVIYCRFSMSEYRQAHVYSRLLGGCQEQFKDTAAAIVS